MDLQEIYLDLNHRLRDMEFLDAERRFFKKIIKEYISDSGLISMTVAENFSQRLFQFEIDLHALREEIINCKTRADMVIEHLVTGGNREIQQEHENLNQRYSQLFATFRKFKQDLFELTSKIIEEESLD